MKKILIFIQSETQFNELKRAAELVNSKKLSLLFCFDLSEGKVLSKLQHYCKDKSWPYVTLNSNSSYFITEDGVKFQAPTKHSRLYYKLLNGFSPKKEYWETMKCESKLFLMIKDNQTQNYELMKMLLTQNNIGLILFGEDGFGTNLALVKAARKLRIQMIVIPYEYSTIKQTIESMQRTPDYENLYGRQRFWNWMALCLFEKKWSRTLNNSKILRTSGYRIMVQELFGFAPKLPWTVHGGHANYIAAESDKMKLHYLNEKIEKSKVVLTGALALDDLYDELQLNASAYNAYLNTTTISPDSINILCAFPGDYVSNNSDCEFNTYEELLDYWIAVLQDLPNVNLSFQVHPAVPQQYRDYIQHKGITLKTQDISELIPHCDLLVTSVSSIIRLAIVCKKPVINYDVYQFNYPDYLDTKGVILVQNKESYKSTLHEFATNPSTYNHYAALQAASAPEWGILDGKAKQRLYQLIQDTLGNTMEIQANGK